MCNGDLLFIDIIAEELKDLDVFGTNMYRGVSFGDAFQKVQEKLGLPILFTEFGADAWNAVNVYWITPEEYARLQLAPRG